MKMTAETVILAIETVKEFIGDSLIESITPNHFGDVIIKVEDGQAFMFTYESHDLWKFFGTWRNGKWDKVKNGWEL